MYDAHTHYQKEVFDKMVKEQKVCCWNSSSKEEYALLKEETKSTNQMISFGIHPWGADKEIFEDVVPILEEVDIVGEIGMDNVWCSVDLVLQERVFKKQLAYAMDQKKPVVLHTKGQEKEIAQILKEYPNNYQVHWFADIKTIQMYVDLDCYFSIGPVVLFERDIQEIVKHIPLNRILVESDGLGAVEWLVEKDIRLKDFDDYMNRTYAYLATHYSITIEDLQKQIDKNYKRFKFSNKGEAYK